MGEREVGGIVVVYCPGQMPKTTFIALAQHLAANTEWQGWFASLRSVTRRANVRPSLKPSTTSARHAATLVRIALRPSVNDDRLQMLLAAKYPDQKDSSAKSTDSIADEYSAKQALASKSQSNNRE